MKGYRTVLFNIGAAVLPILQATDFTDILGAQGMTFYGLAITLANVALRFFTTTPVGQTR